MKVLAQYGKYTDREIIDLIIREHRHEALLYLLYDRYYRDAMFYAFRYFQSFEYLEDLMEELTLHLMGRHGDYAPLASFKGQSSFRTWISRVISNLFQKKLNLLIGFGRTGVSIGEEALAGIPENDNVDSRAVLLLEAIARLKNPDYKFVLVKELEGYSPEEIAAMLEEKRRRENRLRLDKDRNEIIPGVPYVYMLKSRALKEVKAIMGTLNA